MLRFSRFRDLITIFFQLPFSEAKNFISELFLHATFIFGLSTQKTRAVSPNERQVADLRKWKSDLSFDFYQKAKKTKKTFMQHLWKREVIKFHSENQMQMELKVGCI